MIVIFCRTKRSLLSNIFKKLCDIKIKWETKGFKRPLSGLLGHLKVPRCIALVGTFYIKGVHYDLLFWMTFSRIRFHLHLRGFRKIAMTQRFFIPFLCSTSMCRLYISLVYFQTIFCIYIIHKATAQKSPRLVPEIYPFCRAPLIRCLGGTTNRVVLFLEAPPLAGLLVKNSQEFNMNIAKKNAFASKVFGVPTQTKCRRLILSFRAHCFTVSPCYCGCTRAVWPVLSTIIRKNETFYFSSHPK